MRTALALIAALGLALSAGSAGAKPCHDASGKFVKCTAPAATTTTASPAAGGYTLDAKGNCHDATGKMAKKALCSGATTTSTTTATLPSRGVVTTTSTTTTATGGPHCTKGKRCGNACISVKDVCHKQ